MKTSISLAILSGIFLCWTFGLSAQTQFAEARLVFSNGKVLNVELADTPETQLRGLMGRTHLSEDFGMLFVLPREQRMSFWMKNTYIPLSIAFFDKDKRLMSIEKMEPQIIMARQQNLRRYVSDRPGLYALEVNQGWFEKNQIVEKMTFKLFELESDQELLRD